MITTIAVKTSTKIPIPMFVVAKDSGLIKLEVAPGGGAASGTVDRSIPVGREAIFADYNLV